MRRKQVKKETYELRGGPRTIKKGNCMLSRGMFLNGGFKRWVKGVGRLGNG
jgi:hypothetical protein